MQYPEILAIAPGSSVILSNNDFIAISGSSIGEFTHEGYGKFVVETVDEEKKQGNIFDLIKIKEVAPSKNTPQKKKWPISESETRDLSKFVRIQRECIRAKEKAKGKELHKNTTMFMISFMKELKMSNPKDLEEGCKAIAIRYAQEKKFTIKIIEKLKDVINLGKDDFVKMRKEESREFESKFSEKLAYGMQKKIDDTFKDSEKLISSEAKIAYWTTYFNNCKIKNRG